MLYLYNMNYKNSHPYHLVSHSPWPLLLCVTILSAALFIVSWLSHKSSISPFPYIIPLIAIFWWRDVIREAMSGYHTITVQRGLYIGFLLFLLSEIMLFISFFWAFFHSSLAPVVEISCIWPPKGISAINPWGLPLYGTCVLLASGFVLTLAHHAILHGYKYLGLFNMGLCILLGGLFVFLQYNEYYFAQFTISDTVWGSVFYLTTGLHAIHVIIGVCFLFVGFIRLYFDNFTKTHNLGLEFAILYWHLVDAVWLFVFVTYYWWGC